MTHLDVDNDIERGVYQTPSNDDDFYDEYDEDESIGRGPVIAIFFVILLAALVGVVWLAYNMGLRQGQLAAPPVIHASTEPFKVRPEEAGGMEEPVASPSEATLAGTDIGSEEVEVSPPAEDPIVLPDETQVATAERSVTEPTSQPAAANERPVTSIDGELVVPRPSERLRTAAVDEDLTSAPGTSRPGASIAATQPTVQPSTQPEVRPEPRATESATTTTASTQPSTAVGPPAPSTSSARPVAANGRYVVQVASLPERAEADQTWARLEARYGEIIGDGEQDVQTADLGERGTWYRLRIGYYGTRDDANAVCQQLQAAGQDCLVVSR